MKSKTIKILAIETSCDDTSIALLECSGRLKSPKFNILENIISSQIAIHRPFGGVVPNLAKREHLKNLPIILRQVLKSQIPNPKSQTNPKSKNTKLKAKSSKLKADMDYIAVTVGPGLEPALWTGINFAKQLQSSLTHAEQNAEKRGKIRRNSASSPRNSAQPIRLIGVNHLEGHMYSSLLPSQNPKHEARNSKQYLNSNIKNSKHFGFRYSNLEFPAIVLLVSGGHTILLNMKSINKWEKLGETLDDAAGEAFDKVAKMLKLPYPGGPEISKLAIKGNPSAIKFPRPMLNKPGYEFSFSGLKTSVLYYLRDAQYDPKNPNTSELSETMRDPKNPNTSECSENSGVPICKAFGYSGHSGRLKANVAASFQEAVIDVLNKKTERAVRQYKAKSILLCGGVSANKLLRERLKHTADNMGINFIVPDFKYSVDNAAMIAAAAYMSLLQKNKKKLPIEADGNLSI